MGSKTDEVCEDWEDMMDNGVLEEKMEKLKVKKETSKPANRIPGLIPIVLSDRSMQQNSYVPAPVKILRRPKEGQSNSAASAESTSNSQQTNGTVSSKSFKERERAYAEARLRILGSSSGDDDLPIPSLAKANSEDGGASVRRPMRPATSEEFPPANTPIRQPLPPDGTPGFKQRSSAAFQRKQESL